MKTEKPVVRKYLSKAEAEKMITSVGKRSKQLNNDIHKAALSVCKHADDHGDVTLAQRLIAELHKGQRVNALIAWLVAVGPFREPTEDEKKSGITAKIVHAKGKSFLEDEAWGTPFWEFTAEVKPAALQGWALFDSLLSKLEKAAEGGNLQGMDKVAISKIKAAAAGIRPAEV